MIKRIASCIAGNQYERDVNEVERFIIEGGTRGRIMMELTRKFRSIKSRYMKEIVDASEKKKM